MNEANEPLTFEPEAIETEERLLDDDRYPGSFFRVPMPPIAGKTGWSLC
ncbi:MAG: hypothetical protein Q8N96_06175 [Methylovulum sp.]|nr:hypothetical protein [Methylovulum sp.]